MTILSKYWQWLLILPVVAVFFVSTSAPNYYSHLYDESGDFVKWTSPDETANYIFSKFYGQEGKIIIPEKLNKEVKDIIRPRSFRSDNGEMKPMSFLGIILIYGKIVSLTSYKVLPYLTPVFAAIGLVFFYLLVKRLFDKRTALISFLLLATFPPYFYYTARSMFHNVLFTVFFLITLYFLVSMNNKRTEVCTTCQNRAWHYLANNWLGIVFAALAGCFFGLAVATRSSELIWLGPLLLILWLFNLRRTGFTKPLIFVIATLLALMPFFKYNTELYGAFYRGGYSEMNSSITDISSSGVSLMKDAVHGRAVEVKNAIVKLSTSFFFFGFHPRQSLSMARHYIIEMFPWLFWGGFFGALLYILTRPKKLGRKFFAYVTTYLTISAILILYYGSWIFHDNPDTTKYTIGNSYTRYWLPVYLGLIPFAAWLIWRPAKLLLKKLFSVQKKNEKGKLILSIVLLLWAVLIVVIISIKSLTFVAIGSEEGLVFQVSDKPEAYRQWKKVLNLTEQSATIITRYHDKLFFPERKVIVGDFNDQRMLDEYVKIIALNKLYYYNFNLKSGDIRYLNDRKFKKLNIRIVEVEKITDDFTLYQIISVAKKEEKL